MNLLNLFLAEENPDFKIIVVQFDTSSKKYHYKSVLDIAVDDKVVVESPSGFKIVDVVEVIPAIETDMQYNFNLKWIVSKVDVEHYNKCIEMEREATKHFNRLKYTKQRAEYLNDMKDKLGDDGVAAIRGIVRL